MFCCLHKSWWWWQTRLELEAVKRFLIFHSQISFPKLINYFATKKKQALKWHTRCFVVAVETGFSVILLMTFSKANLKSIANRTSTTSRKFSIENVTKNVEVNASITLNVIKCSTTPTALASRDSHSCDKQTEKQRSRKIQSWTLNHFPLSMMIIIPLTVAQWNSRSFRFHSGLVFRRAKMFGNVVKTIVRQELLFAPWARSQRILTRALLTSQGTFYKHHLADNEKDIIVYSPFPSLNYPDCTIDQYVWNDINKWSSKMAVVSAKLLEEISFFSRIYR